MASRASLLVVVLTFGVLVAAVSSIACNTDGDCSEQTCDQFGGSASRKFTSCFSSGSGSSKDEFVLKDESDNNFYTCSRNADDNDSCGVALISAKEAYCKQNDAAPSTSSTTSSSGSTTSSSSSTSSSSGSTSGGGCATPNALVCGTDSAGVETRCPGTAICCYSLGPGSSKTCGAVSKCSTAGAANGASDKCPTNEYQLCKTDLDCGDSYHCSGPTEGYCLEGSR